MFYNIEEVFKMLLIGIECNILIPISPIRYIFRRNVTGSDAFILCFLVIVQTASTNLFYIIYNITKNNYLIIRNKISKDVSSEPLFL